MDGMSCLQTIISWLKESTYGWDVLFTNNESRD